MSSAILYEARLLLISILAGAGLMALYDVLRIFRLLVHHSWLLMGIEDFFYWIFSGFATFYLLYRKNDGALRMYVIGGVFLSMVLYDRIFSANFFRLLKKAGRCFMIRIRKHR